VLSGNRGTAIDADAPSLIALAKQMELGFDALLRAPDAPPLDHVDAITIRATTRCERRRVARCPNSRARSAIGGGIRRPAGGSPRGPAPSPQQSFRSQPSDNRKKRAAGIGRMRGC
jgi:hypothetical protein